MADGHDVAESMLFDILLYLPVISLLRFKTVCKSWCSLIESSIFVTQHLHHNSENNKKSLLMLKCGNNEHSFLSGSKYQVHSNSTTYEQIFPRTGRFEIVNSCNGIICVSHHCTGEGMYFSLWNPATKQVRKLAKPARVPIRGRQLCLKSAFGFDKKANDYKIVRMALHCGASSVLQDGIVEVYSMRTDSWGTIQEGSDFPIAFTKPATVDVAYNGEMFLWIGTSLSLRTVLIFYFDLANEVHGTVPLPDHHCDAHASNLAFLGGKITYVRCRGRRKTCSYCEIWMLEEPILPCEGVGVIHLLKNGEFILTVMRSGTDIGLYLYDLVTQEEILLLDVRKVRTITNYSESLVSVKSTELV